jgi:hypothetical protein
MSTAPHQAPRSGLVTFAGWLTLILGLVALVAGVYFIFPSLWGPLVTPISLTPDLVLIGVSSLGDSWFIFVALALLILGLLGILGGIHVIKRKGVVLALLFAVITMICGALFLRDAFWMAEVRELLRDQFLGRLIAGVCALLYGLCMVIALGTGIKEFIDVDPQETP